jgi:hypothetical protein
MTIIEKLSLILLWLVVWTSGSIVLGLGVAKVMRWSLHYKPPSPHPLPSGSILDVKPENGAVR